MKAFSAARYLLVVLVLFHSPQMVSAQDDVGEVEWMALMLDGQKTGWLKSVRTVHGDEVHHEESVFIAIQRTGVPIELSTSDRSVETLDGRPLAFSTRQDIAGGSMEITGSVAADGTTMVTTRSGGSEQTRTFPWPDGALLPEGLRLARAAAGLEAGATMSASAFIAGSLQAAPMTMTVIGAESVDLFGVDLKLTRTEEVMKLGRSETRSTTWVDDTLTPRKMRFSVMGLTLETISCPEECATAKTQPAEFFSQAFAAAPAALSEGTRARPLRYTVRALREETIHFPSGHEQLAEAGSNGTLEILIHPAADLDSPRFVGEAGAYLGQTRWLQAGAPEIIALLAEAGGSRAAPRETMTHLERFVRHYVSDKTLSVGYATALETARSRSGDCTEHALLLAALGRAAGIPTRVATGLAYVDNWLGARDVFVPHAWTQALIDGRWMSFDAALSGFDAGHLALSYGDGDPWNFYDGVSTLGNFEILAIEPVTPAARSAGTP